MAFEKFVAYYGASRPGTGVDLARLGLDHSAGLQRFVAEVGGGVFGDGFVSLVSAREVVPSLGGWEHWFPPGFRLFGTSAFGFLLLTRGDDLWIAETQFGQVVESGFTIEEAIDELAEPESRENNHEELFKLWSQAGGPLGSTSVLCPTPVIALGGDWHVETLKSMELQQYLWFTGQLFAPGGDMPAEVLPMQE